MEDQPVLENVRGQIAALVAEVLGTRAADINDADTLDGKLQMQSVAFVELQVAIEELFDIELDPLHILDLNQFGAIVGYVRKIIATRGKGPREAVLETNPPTDDGTALEH